MPYYADLNADVPAPYKPKKVVFYRQGLKIYGLLPYRLQRLLKAQFFSNSMSWGRVRISGGTFEANWTAIPYQQSQENMSTLLDWLYSEAGFQVALASPAHWNDDIFSPNVARMPPETWYPAGPEARPGFMNALDQPDRSAFLKLLPEPERKTDQTMDEQSE